MPDLYVDIGNSNIRIAARNGPEWQLLYSGKSSRRESLYTWLDTHTESRIIVSSVIGEMSAALDSRYPGRMLQTIRQKDIPAELVSYRTPSTLGTDRFLVCLGASEQANGNVVVIDSGSACTVDIMTAETVFQGGVIIPGLDIVNRAITEYMPDLKDLPEGDDSLPGEWPGRSSADCLRWGIAGAFLEAVRGFLYKYRESHGDFELFVTGGGSAQIAGFLKESFDLKIRPFLIFDGMEIFTERYLPQAPRDRG